MKQAIGRNSFTLSQCEHVNIAVRNTRRLYSSGKFALAEVVQSGPSGLRRRSRIVCSSENGNKKS